MTLPKPCTVPDCKAPITHWHCDDGLYACLSALNGRPCPHGDPPCYAPRVQPERPLHLPDVDTVARAIYESDHSLPEWEGEDDSVKDVYRRNARAVLDLIASNQPVWKRVEPGTRIEEGQRYRVEYAEGHVVEDVSIVWWIFQDDGTTTAYVLRTLPAEPEDPRVEVLAEEMEAEHPHCDDAWPCAGAERFRGAARRVIARLDEMGGDPR